MPFFLVKTRLDLGNRGGVRDIRGVTLPSMILYNVTVIEHGRFSSSNAVRQLSRILAGEVRGP
jgi:hypothetical protein